MSINMVSVLSGSCYAVKIHLLLEQNTSEIQEDVSIVKLNISNFYKDVIPWTVPV